jgi:hypothetical protein
MHIFLDESGPFLPLEGAKERVSLVGGLVLPTYRLADIYGEYLALRPRLRLVKGEPKGSAQGEDEVAAVISLLRRHDVLFEAICIDVGFHSVRDITEFQRMQADLVAAAPHRDDSAQTIAISSELAQTMRGLPPQLFIQCMLYIEVVDRLIRRAPLYYVQREPRELGTFAWVVDRKGVRVTPFENLWQQIILPFLQDRSHTDPTPMLAGADYSFFKPFEMPRPASATRKKNLDPAGDDMVVDTRAMFKDQLRFADSRDELGLELVDITISALGRALNGTLGQQGWNELGSLMIYQEPQLLRFVHFSPRAKEQGVQRERSTSMAAVVELLQRQGKSMLNDENILKMLCDKNPEGGKPTNGHLD